MVTNERRSWRKALGGLQVTAAVGLLCLIVVLLAGIAPSLFGYTSFVVYSGSMEPVIRVGDLAVVGPVKSDQFMVGNIITYRMAGHPDVVVTHRLVGVGLGDNGLLTFQTKGDANDSVDLVAVDEGAVLGRMAYSIPWIGYLVEFSKRPEGRILLIGIPGLLLALDYLLGRGWRKGTTSLPPAGRRVPTASPVEADLTKQVVTAKSEAPPSAQPTLTPSSIPPTSTPESAAQLPVPQLLPRHQNTLPNPRLQTASQGYRPDLVIIAAGPLCLPCSDVVTSPSVRSEAIQEKAEVSYGKGSLPGR